MRYRQRMLRADFCTPGPRRPSFADVRVFSIRQTNPRWCGPRHQSGACVLGGGTRIDRIIKSGHAPCQHWGRDDGAARSDRPRPASDPPRGRSEDRDSTDNAQQLPRRPQVGLLPVISLDRPPDKLDTRRRFRNRFANMHLDQKEASGGHPTLPDTADGPDRPVTDGLSSRAGRSRRSREALRHYLIAGESARTVSLLDATAVGGAQLGMRIGVAASRLLDVSEQTVRSVHRPDRRLEIVPALQHRAEHNSSSPK